MVNFSAATTHALSVVAHATMAKGMEKNVEGMIGFYDFWLKEQSPKDRKIMDAYFQMSKQAYKDFAVLLAKDLKKDG